MHHATCLCGSVSWDVDGPLKWMSHCHCSRCRKAHGTPFATYVAGQAEAFHLHGEEHVVRFTPKDGGPRCFCGRCGSVVPTGGARGTLVFLPAGSFDDELADRPLVHIFVASKASWYDIPDQLPRFDTFPPGMDAPVLSDREPLDPPGRPRGSCLCGAVAYVVEGETKWCRFCHCQRCRKARSAAYAANWVTTADGVRFTRGEAELVTYKVPDAKYFQNVFCRSCGSCMPRKDHNRDLAVIPMGTLDDDPGVRPREHIFVGSKAEWFDIADALPQYAEYPG